MKYNRKTRSVSKCTKLCKGYGKHQLNLLLNYEKQATNKNISPPPKKTIFNKIKFKKISNSYLFLSLLQFSVARSNQHLNSGTYVVVTSSYCSTLAQRDLSSCQSNTMTYSLNYLCSSFIIFCLVTTSMTPKIYYSSHLLHLDSSIPVRYRDLHIYNQI